MTQKEKKVKTWKKDKLNTIDIRKPSKSLKFVKVMTMICKVLSMIVFVLAIAGTVAGIVLGAKFINEKDTFYNGVQTLETFIWNTYGTTVYAMSLACIAGACACAGGIVVAWFSWRFFGNIFRHGTPFTYKTARDGVRLAIICLGTIIAGAVVYGIFTGIYSINYPELLSKPHGIVYYPFVTKVVYGVIVLVLSFVFRHGAELREANYAPVKK